MPQIWCLGVISPQTQNAGSKGWKGKRVQGLQGTPQGSMWRCMWLNHSQHSFTTGCPNPMPCLAAPKFKFILLAPTVSSPCLSLSALKQKFSCQSPSCRRYVCWEFPIHFFSEKLLSSISCLINRTLKSTQIPPSLIVLGWWGKSSHRGAEET